MSEFKPGDHVQIGSSGVLGIVTRTTGGQYFIQPDNGSPPFWILREDVVVAAPVVKSSGSAEEKHK